MDTDLSGLCEKIVSCDLKVTQNFEKRIHKLGSQKYGMAGKTEISWTDCLMYPFVLYLCFFYIYGLTLFVMTFNSSQNLLYCSASKPSLQYNLSFFPPNQVLNEQWTNIGWLVWQWYCANWVNVVLGKCCLCIHQKDSRRSILCS